MALVAPNGLWLSRTPGTAPTVLSNGSFIEAIAKGDIKLASLQSTVGITSATEVTLGTAARPQLLRVGRNGDSVAIDAASLDVRSGDVLVNNATLTLSSRDTQALTSAAAVHGSGILAGKAWAGAGGVERSVRWSRGHAALPASGADATAMAGARSNVGCWDVRGGGLRIIAETSSAEVAYGFRVNASKDLEIYRRDIDAATSNAVYRRVSRFGNASGGGAAVAVPMLPTSPPL
jgi:hypothetical protein